MEGKGDSSLRFVPEILVDYINKFSRNDLEPASFFLHGVCLLVDISGFTKLSGEFCAQGKSGVDDLQLATNGFMGRLVEIIYTFGGDIIKFAGDAIICVFTADFITSVSSKALRRSTCGFESYKIDLETFMNSANNDIPLLNSTKSSRISPEVILRVMHCARVLREVQTEKLTVHVAMSCGEMCFGILGGFENRWECLISGPCIHQLSDCLDDAPSKTAVISAKCAQVLVDAVNVNAVPFAEVKEDDLVVNKILTNAGMYEFEILPLESGNYRIVEVKCANNIDALAGAMSKVSTKANMKINEHLKLIRQFVPVPVAEELESAANLNYMAEIREVTTMFMKWDSYDANGKHRDLLGLQTCFYQAQRVLQSTGAYLRQFLVDDKGCVLIGCWGMPHLSYLDNGYRAVSSAAQIKHELEELGMNCSFGITTGDVYCGTVGSALRMEYAAIGSVVNMSARLMCKAHGEILIDEATRERLTPSLLRTFIALPLMQVKGHDGLLKVYKYVGSAIGVEEKVVGDHEISIVCKNTLTTLLLKLTPTTTIQTIKSGEVSVPRGGGTQRRASWFPRLTKPVETQAATPSTLPVVLIQGKEGSGRTTVVTWLKAQSAEYSLPAYCVRLTKKDTQQEYGMWRKIFALIMPKDLFLNNNIQRQHVHNLLRKAYNGNPKLARTQGFPVLKAVLGITCEFVAEDTVMKPILKHDSSMFSTSMRSLMSYKIKPAGSSRSRIVQFNDCLMRVFTYLLSAQPALVVVENIELADDESLQLLVDLTKITTRSGFVCTALVDPDSHEMSSGESHDASILHSNAFNSSPWSKQFKQAILSLPVTTSITLENYTAEEIDRMLCVALGLRVVPPEISQLVQDFSGGSYFWVREIIQFLKDHGVDLFMSAIGEEKDDASCAAFESTRPAKRRGSMGVPVALMKTSSFKAGMSSGRNNVAVAPHQQQLNKLVLTRFGSMSSENQRILRTASIIGMTFTEDILLGLLPEHLKLRFADCMSTLSSQKWIYQDSENTFLYHFAHLHSHQIIYQLTPSSERNNLHQLIANYIATYYKDDPSQYAPMCFHLMHCDTDEALQYAVKATSFMLDTEDIFDFGDCLDLLTGLIDCCRSPFDVEVLQQLLARARDTIEALDVSTKAPHAGGLLRFLVCFGSGSSSGGNSASVSPAKPSSEATRTKINNNKVGMAYTHAPGADDGEEMHLDEGEEVNYEQRTKRLLLQQIHDYRNSLCEKHVDLSEEATKHVPKDWQRAYLRL